jgi:putative flippase GtrA
MKRIDIFLALITGFGVGILFDWLLKQSGFLLPFSPLILNLILFFVFPFLTLFGLKIAEILGKKYLFIYQLAKFLLVGALFALLDLLVLNSLFKWFGIEKTQILKYTIFVAISFTIATTLKYLANKYWAFEKVEKGKREFEIFFVITLISLFWQMGIASLVFKLLTSIFNFSSVFAGNLGKILGIIVASIWNFLGYKFVVFKK